MKLQELRQIIREELHKLNETPSTDYDKKWKSLSNQQRHDILTKALGRGYEVSVPLSGGLKSGTIPIEGNVSSVYKKRIYGLIDGLKTK